jgi:hypothetical protein
MISAALMLTSKAGTQQQDQDLAGSAVAGSNPPKEEDPTVASMPALSDSSRRARRQLGLGGEGEKVDYLKIRDYITILSAKASEDDKNVELPDGSTFVPKGGSVSQKPKLENVTALQYMEASMAILGKLVVEGKLSSLEEVVQYAAHVAVIARLGQEKEWRSIVKYDDAYREAQVAQSLTWGEDVRDLRDEHIKERDRPSKQYPSKSLAGPQKGGSGAGKGRGRGRGKTPSGDASDPELRICRKYSEGACTRTLCSFLHLCAKCGSGSHGLHSHPN